VPLDTMPDLRLRAEEIEDGMLLVHRLLYRNGRIGQVFAEEELQPMSERRQMVRALALANRADLYRLEELLEPSRA
jgi:hypothetical protein